MSAQGAERAAAPIRIGMLGLDSSHCTAFAKLLHDRSHPYFVPGARVVAGYPGGSDDFELSASRVEGFTRRLAEEFGAAVADTPEQAAEQADAVMITAADGRRHPELFERVARYGKPVFVDKPLAVGSEQARRIAECAKTHGVPLMSSSSLRYAAALEEALAQDGEQAVIGADAYGPMEIEPTQGGLFWYGIHTVEMLYRVMGPGCAQVTASSNERFDVVVGTWADGRIGTVRGNRVGNAGFGVVIHRERASRHAQADTHPKPLYAGLLEQVVRFMETGVSPVNIGETLEIVRFIEAANESRITGRAVPL